jgi:hypothetical protein
MKLFHYARTTVTLSIGLFVGLLWSQQFYQLHQLKATDQALRLAQRAQHLSHSIENVEKQLLNFKRYPSVTGEEVSKTKLLDTKHSEKDHEQLLIDPILQHQIDLQNQFQRLLRKQQFPVKCHETRILLTFNTTRPADGFARELQDMGRLLQVAIATQRCLVVRDQWTSAYVNEEICDVNRTNHWLCLWQSLSSCSEALIQPSANSTLPANQSSGLAIYEHVENTHYFDTYLYGAQRIREARKWPWGIHAFTDIVPHWERIMGRFWIRSQLSHFLWKPSRGLQALMEQRLVEIDEPYIGMHIRFTDNRNSLQHEFGRDAAVTRSFDNFMEHAKRIRHLYNVSTIYISTDCDQIVPQTNRRVYRNRWKFVFQDNVQRGSSRRHLWFQEGRASAAAGIATDLELLRRANFLIGSHQSNVYRLACQLNHAHFTEKYRYDMRRHFSVDVEWFEDP